MYSLTVSGENVATLLSRLEALAIDLRRGLYPAAPQVPAAAITPQTAAESVGKGKGGRKKQAEEPKQTDIEDVAPSEGNSASAQTPAAPAETAAPNYDEMVSSLQKLNGKHGMQAVRALLGKFHHEKVGQVKPEEYAAVIAEADAQTAA